MKQSSAVSISFEDVRRSNRPERNWSLLNFDCCANSIYFISYKYHRDDCRYGLKEISFLKKFAGIRGRAKLIFYRIYFTAGSRRRSSETFRVLRVSFIRSKSNGRLWSRTSFLRGTIQFLVAVTPADPSFSLASDAS